MKGAHYIKAALWGGAIFGLIEAALQIAIQGCNHNYFWPQCVVTLTRYSLLAHPIANAVFSAMVLAYFDGEKRWLDSWSPTPLEAARDAAIFHGLCLTEAILYGLILGVLVIAAWRFFGGAATRRD